MKKTEARKRHVKLYHLRVKLKKWEESNDRRKSHIIPQLQKRISSLSSVKKSPRETLGVFIVLILLLSAFIPILHFSSSNILPNDPPHFTTQTVTQVIISSTSCSQNLPGTRCATTTNTLTQVPTTTTTTSTTKSTTTTTSITTIKDTTQTITQTTPIIPTVIILANTTASISTSATLFVNPLLLPNQVAIAQIVANATIGKVIVVQNTSLSALIVNFTVPIPVKLHVLTTAKPLRVLADNIVLPTSSWNFVNNNLTIIADPTTVVIVYPASSSSSFTTTTVTGNSTITLSLCDTACELANANFVILGFLVVIIPIAVVGIIVFLIKRN